MLIDSLGDKDVSDGSSADFKIKRSLKHRYDIFQDLNHLGDIPWGATGTGLLVLSAQVPPLYLGSEDDSDTEMESDETENEPASGYEAYAKDESKNDCIMPLLDDLGFINIQPQLEDAETEMLKLIWSISSFKRRYYDQEGLAMAHRILATKGAKLFFIDSKRPSLRHQMLKTVAKGSTPTERQFIHLILVFWSKTEVIELANDLLQKQPSPEQERILQFLTNSEGLFNKDLITQVIEKCHVTPQTVSRLIDLLYHLLFPRALRYVIEDVHERFQQLHPSRDRTILPNIISKMFPKRLSASLHHHVKKGSQRQKSKRRIDDVEVEKEEERSDVGGSKKVKVSSISRT
ncbi:hypothetical protein AU210_016262 [Fusarium oxysporum f. sp. radicis-cucumerinum]|uniref:Uncharacterized protein n=1 Tax=Fusarium oxysporum f. sp. radicis-cucumerinum TaxID=327505 RepID=A0A2H3FR72_FUSOX|nr:hypothetical protein AU210_016262 [Fusarium oxysporum f. sp. radicis-cucumerinum]